MRWQIRHENNQQNHHNSFKCTHKQIIEYALQIHCVAIRVFTLQNSVNFKHKKLLRDDDNESNLLTCWISRSFVPRRTITELCVSDKQSSFILFRWKSFKQHAR